MLKARKKGEHQVQTSEIILSSTAGKLTPAVRSPFDDENSVETGTNGAAARTRIWYAVSTTARSLRKSSMTTTGAVATGALTTTGASSITTADNLDTLSLISTDADANRGPNLRMYRNSGSPADNDDMGRISFDGRNDNSQDYVAARIWA